jgi:hypothetical protein
VQDRGLLSKNVAWISLAHNAPVGTLDKVAMEMNGVASASAQEDVVGLPSSDHAEAKGSKKHPTRWALRRPLTPLGGGYEVIDRTQVKQLWLLYLQLGA